MTRPLYRLPNLRAFREKAFLTQEELAARAGLSVHTVNEVERDIDRLGTAEEYRNVRTNGSNASTVRRLAKALGVKPAALVGEGHLP